MSPGDALEAYLFFLRFERGYAENSIRASMSVQRSWEAWLRKHAVSHDWMQATPESLKGFLHDRAGLADRTNGVTHWHIKSIYAWLQREGHALANPALILTEPARAPRSRTAQFVPTYSQIQRLLDLPDRGTVDGIQDRVMLELLYATGVRSHELLNLQVHTVWPNDRRAIVCGKGRKERLVVMNESAAKWVTYYLRVVHPRLLRRRRLAAIPTRGDRSLFPSCCLPGHLSYSALQKRIKGYAEQAGMPLLTAHTLRRAFATHLYVGGADLRTIQLLLGHAHLATTSHYTRAVTSYLREIIEHHHPRGVHYGADISSSDLCAPVAHRGLQ